MNGINLDLYDIHIYVIHYNNILIKARKYIYAQFIYNFIVGKYINDQYFYSFIMDKYNYDS